MLLAEPPPSQGDIHFRLWDTPIRIHPFFWVTALLLGLGGLKPTPPKEVFIWVFAVLVSILVHEFGHAILQRRYGGRPWITLYALGGLASCNDCDRSSKAQIQISLAGPLTGFLLAAAILILLRIIGHRGGVGFGNPDILYAEGLITTSILGVNLFWKPFESHALNLLVYDFLRINILWGLLNLLPIYPLDGGRVSRELCMLRDSRQGIILSFQISMLCAIAMAVLSLGFVRLFATILFGYLAYSSYRGMQAYKASLW